MNRSPSTAGGFGFMVLGVPELIVATFMLMAGSRPNRRNSVPQGRCGPAAARAGLLAPGARRPRPGRLRRRGSTVCWPAPDPSKWMIAQARGRVRTRCSGDRLEKMAKTDDRANVS